MGNDQKTPATVTAKQGTDYRSLTEHSPGIIARFDREKRFLYVNTSIERISRGIPRDRFIGMTVRSLGFGSEAVDLLERDIDDVFSSGRERKLELSFAVGPRTRWFDVSLFPEKQAAAQDAVSAVLAYARDITEFRETEHALRESRHFTERVLATTPDVVYVFDTTLRRNIYANRLTADILGYSPEEVHKMGSEFLRLLVHPDDAPVLGGHLDRLTGLGEGEILEIEYRMKHSDGTWRWIHSRDTAFVRDADGKVRQVIGTAEDITARKRSEEELRAARALAEKRAREAEEGQQMLEALMENIPEGIIVVDREGRLRGLSRFASDFLQISPEEAKGMTIEDYLRKKKGKGRPPAQSPLPDRLAIENGEVVVNREYVLRTPDGREVVTLGNGGPVRDREGQIIGAVVSWRDITERKKSQEELARSYERLSMVTRGVISAISRLVEKRDPYTAGHQRRVGQLASAIARELGLPEDQAEGIRIAGLLHDIGKIYVPSEILSKPSRLTAIEYDIVKVHPSAGFDVLKLIDFPWPVAQVALQHQERINGEGYPSGLTGGQILFETKIVSVADTIEAMTFHRPYRPEIGLGRALAEIERNRSVLFDDRPVDACLRLFREESFAFEA